MIEKEMGYRGSKSIRLYKKSVIVKEQRVDSGKCINMRKMRLRSTLMGFERNYLVKILSNQDSKIRQLCSSAVSDQAITNSLTKSAPIKP